MKVNRVKKYLIKKNNDDFNIIDEISYKVKNLYNFGNYIIRQEFINTSKEVEDGICDKAKWIRCNELDKMIQNTDSYRNLPSAISQATLRKLDKNWKSFFKSIKDFKKYPEKYSGRPKMPGYLGNKNKDRLDGRYLIAINNRNFKIKNGYIYFSISCLKRLNNKYKADVPENSKLIELRLCPGKDEYTLHLVYEIDIDEIEVKNKRICAIDLGINNLMTIVNNCDLKPIVINGKPLKSINREYNKTIAHMKSNLMTRHNAYTSNRMRRYTNKRNRKVEDYMHKASKVVVDYCIENSIDTLICGYNNGWKDECDMGKVNNQKFVSIPYLSLKEKLKYKCEDVGIQFIEVEEPYTSGTSFLDYEEPIKENYDKKRRIHRGLFVTKSQEFINADVNGAYQIFITAFPDAFKTGRDKLHRHPDIINI